jgi:hypothetical protein
MKKTVQKFIGDAIRQAFKSVYPPAARLPCLPSLTISLSSHEHVEIHNRRHTAGANANCRENPLLAAQILHAQLLQIFAVFYFVDLGEKRFFEFGN